jgi:hypothetical protein
MEDHGQLSEQPSVPTPQPESDADNRLRFFTTPLSTRGWPLWLIYTLAVLGVIYILNPTLGIFEFIPDNIPLVGNLDEGAAFLLIWYGVLEYLQGKKPRPPASNSE